MPFAAATPFRLTVKALSDVKRAGIGRTVKVVHRPSGTVLAEGPLGWGMTPFDGGIYIRRRHLVGGSFTPGVPPGLCVYKGLYISLDYSPPEGSVSGG